MAKPVVLIDGRAFADLEGFFDHFEHRALHERGWGHNLDAFNDVLRGGFGTPKGGFVLAWRHHALSRQRLGYDETMRQLHRMLLTSDPHNVAAIRRDIAKATAHLGKTVYDWLLDIIREHGPGGVEAEDGVELVLQ